MKEGTFEFNISQDQQ